jgi:hypothetical protein
VLRKSPENKHDEEVYGRILTLAPEAYRHQLISTLQEHVECMINDMYNRNIAFSFTKQHLRGVAFDRALFGQVFCFVLLAVD